MSNDARFPLAFDAAGNPIELPEDAKAWRVRRGGGRRGRPKNVFDTETGRQLKIPLGATLDEMIDANCPPDRYLLYPVNAEGHVIPGIVAVTEVPEDDEEEGRPDKPRGKGLKSELLRTVTDMAATLCRALEATTGGYGPVRSAPHMMLMEQPAPAEDSGSGNSLDMGQIIGVAKSVIDTFNGKTPTPTGDGA